MKKVAIIGSRTFTNYRICKEVIENIVEDSKIMIVSGGAKGADALGEKFADENNLMKLIFKPDWEKFGKSAGFKRNTQIIENSDIVIAFWDYESKGTKNSIDTAKKLKKDLYIIDTRNIENLISCSRFSPFIDNEIGSMTKLFIEYFKSNKKFLDQDQSFKLGVLSGDFQYNVRILKARLDNKLVSQEDVRLSDLYFKELNEIPILVSYLTDKCREIFNDSSEAFQYKYYKDYLYSNIFEDDQKFEDLSNKP